MLWTQRAAAGDPVDKAVSSPGSAHRRTALLEPEHGVIPVIHTPYDFYKGIT
jgi:hypothetical protein